MHPFTTPNQPAQNQPAPNVTAQELKHPSMAAPTISSLQSRSQLPSPRDIIVSGVRQNSIHPVRHDLDLFAHSSKGLNSFTLDWALSFAIKKAQPDIARYLIDETDIAVERLSPLNVGYAVRQLDTPIGEGEVRRLQEVLEVLVEKGWDINSEEGSG